MVIYKLYETTVKYEQIDAKTDESKIIEKMIFKINKNKNARFLVVKNVDGSDVYWDYIDNKKDLDKYIANYELRQKSCVELKKEITSKIKVLKR